MAIDTASPRPRRAVLAAAVSGAAALGAAAIARPAGALAANGDPLLLGQANTASSATTLTRDTVPTINAPTFVSDTTISVAVAGNATSGQGVVGRSQSSAGVQGYSQTDAGVNGFGVYGVWASGSLYGVQGGGDTAGVLGWGHTGVTGILGYSGGWPLPEAPAKTGVYGYAAQDATAAGVTGSSTVGTGVFAVATTGTALRVSGKARFSRSGKASVAAGRSYVDITVAGGLTSHSVVHATLQTYRSGVAVAAVRVNYPSAGKARIYLTKVASASAGTYVGWLVAEY
jgi:hypothetical protein